MKDKKTYSKKKGQIHLSTTWVVIVIMGFVLLILLSMFITKSFRKATVKLDELSQVTVNPPETIISSPINGHRYKVAVPITFDASQSYDLKGKIKAYFWDFDGDLKPDNDDTSSPTATYVYDNASEYTITLWTMNNRDGVGKASIKIFVIPDNVKDPAKYVPKPLFIVNNSKDMQILRGFTLMFDEEMEEYPYMAYTNPNDLPRLAGYTQRKLTDLSLAGYLSYWKGIASFVVIKDENQEGSLLAALLATYHNSPLLFKSELGSLTRDQKSKTFYIIEGDGFNSSSPELTQAQITGTKNYYNIENLRDTATNPYQGIYADLNVT